MTMVTTIGHMGFAMQTIKASEFKAKCLALMDEVARTGEPIVVSKNGKSIVELRPHAPVRKSALGALKGQIEITGDIISPAADPGDWEALR